MSLVRLHRPSSRERRKPFVGLVSLLALALACQPSTPPSAPATAAEPAPSERAAAAVPAAAAALPAAAPASGVERAPDLSAVERTRLEYALASARLIARDWPWLRTDETCVLLLAAQAQWVTSCATPPPQFVKVGAELLGKPVYARISDSLEMAGQKIPTTAFVRAVPATADVPLPGDRTKGLAQETPWIIASSLDMLIGAHPAFDEKTTTEEWLSVFLHEFFHTRQLLQPSFRDMLIAMKSGKVDAAALDKLFTNDTDGYRGSLEREYQTLVEAASRDAALTASDARKALAQWYSLYEQRRAQLERLGGEVLVRADVALTYVEGTARYVETQFLNTPSLHADLPLAGDSRFQGFRSFSSKPGYAGLKQKKLGNRYYYTIGMHLALVLDRADPTWKARVSEQADWIIGLARSVSAGSGARRPQQASSPG